MIIIHGESHMNTYQVGRNRPRKKSLGYVCVIVSIINFQSCVYRKQKNVSILEAATRGILKKKLFLKISQYSQENACIGVSLIKLQT